GIRIVSDVPVAGLPVALHGAVLEGDPDAFVGRALRQGAPDLTIAWQAFGQGPAANPAGKAGDAGRAEVARIIDAIHPSLQRLAIHLAVLERIAEHPQRRNRHVALADRVATPLAQLRQLLLVRRLPEERL